MELVKGQAAASSGTRSTNRLRVFTDKLTKVSINTSSEIVSREFIAAILRSDINFAAPVVMKKTALGKRCRAVPGNCTCLSSSTAERTTCALASPAAQVSATQFGLK